MQWGASTASIAFRIRSDLTMPLDVRLAIREAFVEPEERHAMARKVRRGAVVVCIGYILADLEALQSMGIAARRRFQGFVR